MDKLQIVGGKRLSERGAPDPVRGPADGRRPRPVERAAPARRAHDAAPARADRPESHAGRRERRAERIRHQHPRRTVRAGEDDARVDPRAGPDAGALRRSQGVAAGRLRDRFAPRRPAHQGPAPDGRRHHDRRRLHPRESGSPEGRPHPYGHDHRDGHREPPDGRRAGRRRDRPGKRGARTGSDGPREHARRDGRQDRRHRHRSPRDPGRRQPAWNGARRHLRPHRSGHVPVRRRGDGRRHPHHPHPHGHLRRGHRQAARDGRPADHRRRQHPRAHGRPPAAGLVPYHGIPRLPDRHAGPVHGREHDRERPEPRYRNDLRKPLHARAGTEPPGRADFHRGQHGLHRGRRPPRGRARDGDRPARLGFARHRRPGRRGHDPRRPHLSPRSRGRPKPKPASFPRRREPKYPLRFVGAGKIGPPPARGPRFSRRGPSHQTSHMNDTTRDSSQLILALSKGRIFEDTLPLLAAAGIEVLENPETSRKLILATNDPGIRVLIVRATDVPTYVQHGAADFGVAGKDVLLEHGGEGLYQPIDLNIACCRMSVAVNAGFDYETAVRQGARLRVATKFVHTAREHFAKKGVHVDLIKLYGSMELAPLVGLSDAIVDVVSTGGTLRANNLVEVEKIMEISSRLVVNQAALKLKRERLQPIIDAFERASKQQKC
ncbi:hypothetical protein Lal_00014947 [Lupinus albus]|nr:hypothetical protein Lal_00014947 [Lupinus albus]